MIMVHTSRVWPYYHQAGNYHAIESSGTASSGVEPPAIKSCGVEPPAIAPPAIDAAGAESAGTKSAGTESAGAESAGAESAGTESAGTESAGAESPAPPVPVLVESVAAAAKSTAATGAATVGTVEYAASTTIHPVITAVVANPSLDNVSAALHVANHSLDRALADAASDAAHFLVLEDALKAFGVVARRIELLLSRRSARDMLVLVARVLRACKGRPNTPLLMYALQLTFYMVNELVFDLETYGPDLVDNICGTVVGMLGDDPRGSNFALWARCILTKCCDIAGIRRRCVAAGGIQAVCALPAHRTRGALLADLLKDANADACAEVIACGGLDVLQQCIQLGTGPVIQRLSRAMHSIAGTATARCRVIEAEMATLGFENANLRQSEAVAKARVEQSERAEWEAWVAKTKREITALEITTLEFSPEFSPKFSSNAIANIAKTLDDIAAKDEARAGMEQARGTEMDAIVHLAAVVINPALLRFSAIPHVEPAHAHSMLDAVTSFLERRATAGAPKSDATMGELIIVLFRLSNIRSLIRAANDARLARGLAACAAVMDAKKDAAGSGLSNSISTATNFSNAVRSRNRDGLPFEKAQCLLETALYILHRYSGWPGGLPARVRTSGYVCCLINSLGSRSDAVVQSLCVASGALEDIATLLDCCNGTNLFCARTIMTVENALAVAVHLMATDDGRAHAFAKVGGARAADSAAQAIRSLSESAKKDVLHIVRICAAAQSSAALRKAEERAAEAEERAAQAEERATEAEERAAKAEERAAEAKEGAAKAKERAEECAAETTRVIAAIHRLVVVVPAAGAGAGGTAGQDLPAGASGGAAGGDDSGSQTGQSSDKYGAVATTLQ